MVPAPTTASLSSSDPEGCCCLAMNLNTSRRPSTSGRIPSVPHAARAGRLPSHLVAPPNGGAKQLSRLATKLAKAGAAGKLGHDVSSQPRLAFRLDKETILPDDLAKTGSKTGPRLTPETRP